MLTTVSYKPGLDPMTNKLGLEYSGTIGKKRGRVRVHCHSEKEGGAGRKKQSLTGSGCTGTTQMRYANTIRILLYSRSHQLTSSHTHTHTDTHLIVTYNYMHSC